MSHDPGLLPTPTKAAAHLSAGLTANLPVMGHRVELTPRDLGSGVIMTWIPVPANGMLPTPQSHVHQSPVFGPRPPPEPPRPTYHPAMVAYPPPRPPPPDPHRPNLIGRLPKVHFLGLTAKTHAVGKPKLRSTLAGMQSKKPFGLVFQRCILMVLLRFGINLSNLRSLSAHGPISTPCSTIVLIAISMSP